MEVIKYVVVDIMRNVTQIAILQAWTKTDNGT